MALSTYADLKTAVATWAMRTGDDGFEAAVPDFIALAEQLIAYGTKDRPPLRVADMEAVAVAALYDDEAQLPSDYLELRSVTVGGKPLEYVTPERAAELAQCAGQPRYYTIIGQTLAVPGGGSSDVSLNYYAAVPPLSDANPTNWLLTKAPNVYLFGSLLQSAPFMMDDQRVATWGTFYDQAIGGMTSSDKAARWSKLTARVKGPTP